MLKEDIRRDLGSDLSRSQEVVLEAAARAWVILSSLDDFIARQSTLVNARKKTVLPVVQTRMQVAEGLARNLERLSPGLSRVAKPTEDLDAWIARKRAEKAAAAERAEQAEQDDQAEQDAEGDDGEAEKPEPEA